MLVSHMVAVIFDNLVSNIVGPKLIGQPMRNFNKCGHG